MEMGDFIRPEPLKYPDDFDPEVIEADKKYADEHAKELEKLGMTEEQWQKYIFKQHCEEEDSRVKLSRSEEAYRRGYLQGFVAGRNTDVEYEEVRKWRYSDETVAPPGSGLAGMHLDGLTESEEHRFFINRLKKDNWSE